MRLAAGGAFVMFRNRIAFESGDGSGNMSADFLSEQSGPIEPHGALAEAPRTLASVGMESVARAIPFKIEAGAEAAHLDENHADRSIEPSPAGDRTSFGGRFLGGSHSARSRPAQGPHPSEGRELYRLAVETCPSGMVIADTVGVILMVNCSVERMFRYVRGALLRQSVDILVPELLRPLHVGRSVGFHTVLSLFR
jgi:PAS domain-containing protein